MSGVRMEERGAEWIGALPTHWERVRICHVARLESGHTPSRQHPEYWIEEECVVPWFTLSDVWQIRDGVQIYLSETKERVSKWGLANSSARLLPAGTVVLSRTASVGFSGIMGHAMATTQDFANWVCGDRLMPEFLLQCLRAMRPDFDRLTMGSTHKTIYMPDIRAIEIPLPPRREQEFIVSFLARRTATIDALLEKKQRLVERLREKRQALITEAVTRGLDANVPRKASGIDWLGEIPAHWAVLKIARVAQVCNGTTPNRERQGYWLDGTVAWLSSGKVNDYRVLEADERITELARRECGLRLIPSGSVLVGMIGQGRTRGMSAYLCIDACINQNVAAIIPGRSLDGRFLHHALTHAYGPLRESGRGGQQDALNCEILGAFKVQVPPLDEQRRIADHLDDATARIDRAVAAIAAQLDRLREYRQALITEAVTGRIPLARMEAL